MNVQQWARTRVFENRFGEKTSIGRGNLSFSTINLPKIAIETVKEVQIKTNTEFDIGINTENYMTEEYKKTVVQLFLEKLEMYAEIMAEQLYERYKFQKTALVKQFPLLMSGLWLKSEELESTDIVEKVLKHGTLGMGFIGLAEALIVLTGNHHGESEKEQQLGIQIVTQLNQKAQEFSNKYDLNFNIFASPAERSARKFIEIDKQKYGLIPKVTDKQYYTNSSHIPEWYECTREHKAKIEAPYHNLTRGGNIFCIKLPSGTTHSPEEVEDVVDLMDKYDMGYGTINFSKSKCDDCGFEIIKLGLKYCPVCDSENIRILQRI